MYPSAFDISEWIFWKSSSTWQMCFSPHVPQPLPQALQAEIFNSLDQPLKLLQIPFQPLFFASAPQAAVNPSLLGLEVNTIIFIRIPPWIALFLLTIIVYQESL